MAGWARKAQDEGHRSATFTPIQDGRWFAGDFEQDQLLEDGTFVLKCSSTGCPGGLRDTASTEPRWSTTTARLTCTAAHPG